jgi:endonuclease/exonuclease/phosphatase family metal-dependent hydrolase
VTASLRIATFNLESLDDHPGLKPPLDERIAVLRPQLLRLEADIVCLQEVNGQKPPGGGPRRLAALDRLLETTPYGGYHRVATTLPGQASPADKHNLVTLSRWPIARSEQLRHDLVPAPTYRKVTARPGARGTEAVEWDRPLLHCVIPLPCGRDLHVLNLHLRAPLAAPVAGAKLGSFCWNSTGAWAEGFFIATVKRAGQALEARLRVDAILDQDPDAWIAACGDFNAEEQEMPLRTLLASVDDTGNARLAPRSLVPLEHSLPQSQRFSVLHGGRHVMLDHIVVSRSLMGAYRHVEIHNESLGDELVAYAGGQGSPESYHAPLVASFALPPPSSG